MRVKHVAFLVLVQWPRKPWATGQVKFALLVECLEFLERPSVTILFMPEGLGQAAKGGRMPSRQEIDVVLTNYVAKRCRF